MTTGLDTPDHLSEQRLPACVRDVLEALRRSRPGVEVTCLSFHTRKNGRDMGRMGMRPELFDDAGGPLLRPPFRARDLLVLSIAVTHTTVDNVETVTHVLVTRTSPLESASVSVE
ncbi:MAG TPA: hypothetical protein VF147_12520 [Vicinamibacterales bacterium]